MAFSGVFTLSVGLGVFTFLGRDAVSVSNEAIHEVERGSNTEDPSAKPRQSIQEMQAALEETNLVLEASFLALESVSQQTEQLPQFELRSIQMPQAARAKVTRLDRTKALVNSFEIISTGQQSSSDFDPVLRKFSPLDTLTFSIPNVAEPFEIKEGMTFRVGETRLTYMGNLAFDFEGQIIEWRQN